MFIIGGPLLLAFGLLVGTKVGRVIPLIIFAMVVVSMFNEPAPNERAQAMKAGTFSCEKALEDKTKFEDDVWAYCSGVHGGEAQWTAMVQAKTDQKWDDLAKEEADEKAAYDAKNAEWTALGQRAAKGVTR